MRIPFFSPFPLLITFLLSFSLLCSFSTSSSAEPLRVTLLLEHKADSTWYTLLREGLAEAAASFGLQTKVVVEENEELQEAVFQREAGAADVILVATDHFHEILRDNARRFPKVRFGCIDAGIRGKNIRCVSFADEEASFLAGAAAALFAKSQNGSIGWISGEDVAAMRSLSNGFQEGAKLAVPEIRVIQGIVGSFSGGDAAKKEATRLLDAGVSVLVLAAGAGNDAILQEAKARGIYVIGLDRDQKNTYPGHVLLSICKDVKGAVKTILTECAKGSFQGAEIDVAKLGNGVFVTKPSDSLGRTTAPIPTIERRMAELEREIKNGGIHLKSLRQKTLCNCL